MSGANKGGRPRLGWTGQAAQDARLHQAIQDRITVYGNLTPAHYSEVAAVAGLYPDSGQARVSFMLGQMFKAGEVFARQIHDEVAQKALDEVIPCVMALDEPKDLKTLRSEVVAGLGYQRAKDTRADDWVQLWLAVFRYVRAHPDSKNAKFYWTEGYPVLSEEYWTFDSFWGREGSQDGDCDQAAFTVLPR